MRIHQIHNKLNREADTEQTRMSLVIQLTRNDIFDLLRSYYPFLYSQIVEREHETKMLYKREQRLRRQAPAGDDGQGTIDYHPFQTLFQLTCRFIEAHEPLTIRASHVNELETETTQTTAAKPKVDVNVMNAQHPLHNLSLIHI